MDELEVEIKRLIISVLNLEDTTVADINSNEPLFVEGLGLDSIDALELGIAMRKKYGLTLSPEAKQNQDYFSSVASLARFVQSQKQKAT
jgi:acyl carrier protein